MIPPKRRPSEACSVRLAIEQRDLLGVFAQTRQRKAEIGLHVLAFEIDADQGTPDHDG